MVLIINMVTIGLFWHAILKVIHIGMSYIFHALSMVIAKN